MGTKLLRRNRRAGKHYGVPLVSLRHDTAPLVAIAPGLERVTWNTPLPVQQDGQDEALWISDEDWLALEARLKFIHRTAWLNTTPSKTGKVEVEEEENESWTIH